MNANFCHQRQALVDKYLKAQENRQKEFFAGDFEARHILKSAGLAINGENIVEEAKDHHPILDRELTEKLNQKEAVEFIALQRRFRKSFINGTPLPLSPKTPYSPTSDDK